MTKNEMEKINEKEIKIGEIAKNETKTSKT
jgi:hypothetical protein